MRRVTVSSTACTQAATDTLRRTHMHIHAYTLVQTCNSHARILYIHTRTLVKDCFHIHIYKFRLACMHMQTLKSTPYAYQYPHTGTVHNYVFMLTCVLTKQHVIAITCSHLYFPLYTFRGTGLSQTTPKK